jgi:hypothetical protein
MLAAETGPADMFGFAAAVATKLLTTSAANVANLIAAEVSNFIIGDFQLQ